MMFLRGLTCIALAAQAAALSIGGRHMTVERGSDGLQDIVTYDEHSLMVHGERVYVFSGEFHPYRLPVPDLWLDVFQKVKALGFNAVSFYVHWALLEGEPGTYSADGIFAFEPFFDAAKEAGIYLIARPGPYINAEVTGGGFPGWIQRLKGQLRTRAPDFLEATDNYMAHIGKAIAKAQITNGGPVILAQPENEYTGASGQVTGGFPDPEFFAYVQKQLRDAGVVVPLISNDASPKGLFAPGKTTNGTAEANVDIYAHDGYPLGFDCAHPYTWPSGALPTNWHATHEDQSPATLYSIMEFQGGSFDPWGGLGFAQCSVLLNMEFERVFYKNNFASGATLLNIYMIYGGTNWGNLGHAGGYTSYDYGSSIDENRQINREKYSELKLEANFLKVSPAFLTASVGKGVTGSYSDSSTIFTTPILGNGSATNFYVVRHSDFQKTTSATYKMNLKTSHGTLSLPQLDGSLTLSGRDSKWHATDYDLGGTNLLYSTAEIFTWKKFDKKTVLVVYGGPGEQHELAIVTDSTAKQVEGSGVTAKSAKGTVILNWKTSTTRQVVQVGDVLVYILDRNTAYNYWVPDFARTDEWGTYTSNVGKRSSVIVEAGYLVRSVSIKGNVLNIDGDLNATVPIKVIGAPANTKELRFNNDKLDFTTDSVTGELSSTLKYASPKLSVPDLSKLDWKYLDNLPEIQTSYDDSAWTAASHTTSNNPYTLQTPTSLFSSDYGYHTGVLVYRGHFVAKGDESTFKITTQGGSASGSSVWLNSTYIGSWAGIDAATAHSASYTLPNLSAGKSYVFTVVVDNNGLDENWVVGPDEMKHPRGILNYSLNGRAQSDITWKLTGNLGGESYIDKARGPLNEGGLYAERQGFTQPNPPNEKWVAGNPETGIDKAGIAFYQTSFDLDLPENYDIALSFKFGNTTINNVVADYRAQLWVNGYQFGKYANNIGPQSEFPVPQGILNYHGENWLAIELWAQQSSGAHLTDFTLQAGTPIRTSMNAPKMAPVPSYKHRKDAY
ncbi:Beta-galactosidase [Venustampulla echinocandica]|uniref:Beta-galactosidase n=1 Tax=Venustampulla echinocandica TaxID=2656787 RepID=A0A370TWV4_9HELO|nr:Beta-galactosidase [Venustampulla echinocandica]RDL39958.1 Beta-galactosidase [Venustampulla echinocandica]